VREIRSGDDDRVNIGIGDDVLVARRKAIDAPLGATAGEELLVRIAGGDKFGAGIDAPGTW